MPEQNPDNTMPTPARREDDTEATKRVAISPTTPSEPSSTTPTPVTQRASGSTAPASPSQSSTAAAAPPALPPAPVRPLRWPWLLLGLLVMIAIIAGGGYMGYQAAIELRQQAALQQTTDAATQHFMLGLVAQQQKQYAQARQHFEYVIMLDPGFPDVQEKLTEVIMAQMATATATIAPTPTLILPTATPDLRTQQQIYDQARQEWLNKDWDKLFLSIDALRTVDPSYNAVQLDGMLYTALRFRGIRKIYQEANLEGGTYDLAMAERIAPLDDEADGARNAARAYMNAIAFWGADWGRVVEQLSQVAPAMPGLRDPSGMTASERYTQALLAYAAQLATADACAAESVYNDLIAMGIDPNLGPTATAVWVTCHGTSTPEPTITQTPTPTVPGETPIPMTDTPVPTVEVPPTAEPPTAEPPTAEPPTETPPTP